MKSAKLPTAGGAPKSVRKRRFRTSINGVHLSFAITILLVAGAASGQALYKYQDENGDWIYTDRPPTEEQTVEIRHLPTGAKPPTVSVTTRLADRELQFVARNDYHAPIEVVLALDELTNLQNPASGQVMRWIVDPRSELKLLALPVLADEQEPAAKFRFIALLGDPRSRHVPQRPYRAPFAVASDYPITQAFPLSATHKTADSRYSVDIAMPIGTDIHAARGGIVIEVASTNFRGGVNRERDAATANIVRILHDDGTHAVYAHLNLNSIRVQAGDEVERGQYIADSGNTGFSSGPHLHFAVLRNAGLRIESVPIKFEGLNSAEIQPTTGDALTAY
jgi:murein DD-endopeptidase MepM/ murein hydrolase activator NlpD